MSADPAFRGDATRMNPEQLLVMAAASCQLLSFLAVAARARLDVVAYEDEAEAAMPEGDRPVRIVSIPCDRGSDWQAGRGTRRACANSSRLRTGSVTSPTA